MIDISKVHYVNCGLCAILGTFFNSLLIWLIVNRSVAEIRLYSRILLQTCVIDLYTIITMIIAQPVVCIVSGWNITYENGPAQYLPFIYKFMFMLLWYFGFYFSNASNALQFFYRYLVLCREMKISPLRYFLMLCITSTPVFGYVWLLANIMYPDQSLPIASLTTQIFFDIHETVEIVILNYSNTLPYYLLCSCTVAFDVVCYVVIIIFGIKIRKYIVKAAQQQSLSSRAVMYNRQISITLALQAILPCASSLVSIAAVLISALVGKASSVYFHAFIIMPLHWIPVINPVITIVVVGSYRRAMFRKFFQKRVTTVDVNVATVRTATNKVTATT